MNYIVASIFTDCIDPQRGSKWIPTLSIVKDWVDSGITLCTQNPGIRLVVFFDSLPEDMISYLDTEYVDLIQVDPCNYLSPNEYRWAVYKQFILDSEVPIESIFFTDISDVIIRSNPFLCIEEHTLYSGDEEVLWNTGWMVDRNPFYIANVDDYLEIFNQYKSTALLNCGIVGGTIDIVTEYLNRIVDITEHTLGKPYETTDMVNHNYVARKYFNKIVHGAPVNSVFKKFQEDREDVWFIHK